MKIYFVRHGQSEGNIQGTLSGQLDVPLTEEGIAQARKTSLEMPSDFSHIYSSDLKRCKQTTDVLNEKLNAPVTYDSRLRERNFGSLQGKTWEEAGPDLRAIDMAQQYDYQEYGGESAEDVKKRLLDFIAEIKKTEAGKKILVVTSAGIIRLLHYILKGEVQEKIHNSSLHEFEFQDN